MLSSLGSSSQARKPSPYFASPQKPATRTQAREPEILIKRNKNNKILVFVAIFFWFFVAFGGF